MNEPMRYLNKTDRPVKPGQYYVADGKFAHKYLVYKVMAKTAQVIILHSYNGSDFKPNGEIGMMYRYPLDLLTEQIKDSSYTP